MDQETQKIIEDRIQGLPKPLREFFERKDWKELTNKIARQFNLKPEQAVALENEVFLTLLCFEMPSAFKENIKMEVGLDENAGRRISDSINGTVFARVMGEIKNAWGPNTGSMNYEVRSMGNEKTYESGHDPYREPLET